MIQNIEEIELYRYFFLVKLFAVLHLPSSSQNLSIHNSSSVDIENR